MKKYIRFGEIPPGEKSQEYFRDAPVKYLAGVSVYDAKLQNGKYHIVLPNPCNECTIDTIHGLLLDTIVSKSRRAYLVTGKLVGRGTDGEPLIRDINVIEDITEQFAFLTDNTQ